MTATAHALIGGAIASALPNPGVGITLSFISHPLLDMIPHWDAGWGWRKKSKTRLFLEGSIDLTVGFFLSYLIFGTNLPFWYFFACVFASVVWDLLEVPYWFLRWNFPPFSSMYKFQSKIQGKAKLPWGVLTQVATVVAVVFVLTNVSVNF